MVSGFKRRSPFIVGHNSRGNNKKKDPIFCPRCNFSMTYIDAFGAYACNNCGILKDVIDPLELEARTQREKQSRESTYTIADGSQAYSEDTYSDDNLRFRKHLNSSGGGITRNTKGAVENRYNPKSDMDKVFERETNVLERGGNYVTSQHTEIKKSPDIISSSDLVADKMGGNVGIMGRSRRGRNEKH
jgi:hypothetical protein